MNPTNQETCPVCDMPYQEIWSDGRCGVCDVDLIAASSNPLVQQVARENRIFVDLVRECQSWGAAHNYPPCHDYPQYERLLVIGCHFKENGGFNRMRRALTMLDREICDDENGSCWSGFVEFAWRDIGGWTR
jgi:hypothetical protein